jgi:hypothetical protein
MELAVVDAAENELDALEPPRNGEGDQPQAGGGVETSPDLAKPARKRRDPSNTSGGPPPPVGEVQEDWRTRLAGDDPKLRGYLERIPSERALVETLKQTNDALKAGQLLRALPADPSPAELSEWRRANGVPERPEGYLDRLPDGLVVGEADRPWVERFLAEMHQAHARPEAVNAALGAYYAIVEEQHADQLAAAAEAKAAALAALRSDWGAATTRTINRIKAHLDSLPEAVAAAFREGRGPNGLPLANNPDLLRWLAEQADHHAPLATLTPGTASSQASAIADELAALEARMGNRSSDYWKGPAAAGLQARYVELVEARERLGR